MASAETPCLEGGDVDALVTAPFSVADPVGTLAASVPMESTRSGWVVVLSMVRTRSG